jgi:glycosyltransferase involved in cell wall biosynthesis
MIKPKSPRICIVIPAYNEGSVISDVVSKSATVFASSPYDFDIVVVNDGSTDDTSLNASSGGATVIDHVLNSGAGGATATGLSYANQFGYDFAATMDADGQHDPADVLRGIDEIIKSKSDLLIGSRLIDSSGMSRVKVLGNRGLSFITYVLFGSDVTDSQSGLRIFSKKALTSLRWKTSGYEFCSEMLWRAKQQNMIIGEYPIKAIYSEYSVSKGQNNWNAINIIKSLVKRRIAELLG